MDRNDLGNPPLSGNAAGGDAVFEEATEGVGQGVFGVDQEAAADIVGTGTCNNPATANLVADFILSNCDCIYGGRGTGDVCRCYMNVFAGENVAKMG